MEKSETRNLSLTENLNSQINIHAGNKSCFDSQEPDPPRFLSISIPDEMTLYRHYMPFIANGGLFINTEIATYHIGDRLCIKLQLPAQQQQLVFVAKIIWLAFGKAVAKTKQGIGVQFEDEGGVIQTMIEGLTIAQIDSGKPTLTL